MSADFGAFYNHVYLLILSFFFLLLFLVSAEEVHVGQIPNAGTEKLTRVLFSLQFGMNDGLGNYQIWFDLNENILHPRKQSIYLNSCQ